MAFLHHESQGSLQGILNESHNKALVKESATASFEENNNT